MTAWAPASAQNYFCSRYLWWSWIFTGQQYPKFEASQFCYLILQFWIESRLRWWSCSFRWIGRLRISAASRISPPMNPQRLHIWESDHISDSSLPCPFQLLLFWFTQYITELISKLYHRPPSPIYSPALYSPSPSLALPYTPILPTQHQFRTYFYDPPQNLLLDLLFIRHLSPLGRLPPTLFSKINDNVLSPCLTSNNPGIPSSEIR